MTNTHQQATITIDASNIPLGRLASKVATILNGKDTAKYEPRILPTTRVHITNASKIILTGKKKEQKVYVTHTSGYLGGQKRVSIAHKIANPTKGYRDVVSLAIYGMLPPNRSRNKKMLHLKITE
ncbi:MAG: 50S ribosomal protein L13 [Alphaproteobacteria bacterium]|nr:50S ribosomal protein L13 [Alphaproteobacteria bacterium]